MSKIIIISGLPGTGKSTLAKHLSKKFNLPLIMRDHFKELMFDNIGVNDRDWSEKLGRASWDILWYSLAELIKSKSTFIIESNFNPDKHSKIFQKLIEENNYESYEINCFCDGEKLFERFQKRAKDGTRHIGHCDHEPEILQKIKPNLLEGKIPPLNIKNSKIQNLDTTNLKNLNYKIVEDFLEL